jgi:hypothetical protein
MRLNAHIITITDLEQSIYRNSLRLCKFQRTKYLFLSFVYRNVTYKREWSVSSYILCTLIIILWKRQPTARRSGSATKEN